jgi:glycosyltransferase involved in cell wall biosynthesis
MKVEVLCATMYQKDFSKFKEMNIQTDVVYANQADCNSYLETKIDGKIIKMITTPYRGVGKNRNVGLLYCSGDILMFSDDDMVYSENYEKGVSEAFESLKDADMIIFQCTTDSVRSTPKINKIARVNYWNFMRYGTVGFVIKKESLLKNNLFFSHLFGGGSRYCSGEDSLFLREALKKGLKIYSHPYTIAHVNDEKSTWFEGFNEKYYFDNGAWLENAFPFLKHFLVWYFAFKFAKRTKLSMCEILLLQYAGIKAFSKGFSYDDWKKTAPSEEVI